MRYVFLTRGTTTRRRIGGTHPEVYKTYEALGYGLWLWLRLEVVLCIPNVQLYGHVRTKPRKKSATALWHVSAIDQSHLVVVGPRVGSNNVPRALTGAVRANKWCQPWCHAFRRNLICLPFCCLSSVCQWLHWTTFTLVFSLHWNRLPFNLLIANWWPVLLDITNTVYLHATTTRERHKSNNVWIRHYSYIMLYTE